LNYIFVFFIVILPKHGTAKLIEAFWIPGNVNEIIHEPVPKERKNCLCPECSLKPIA